MGGLGGLFNLVGLGDPGGVGGLGGLDAPGGLFKLVRTDYIFGHIVHSLSNF